jgi:hypothetical protein
MQSHACLLPGHADAVSRWPQQLGRGPGALQPARCSTAIPPLMHLTPSQVAATLYRRQQQQQHIMAGQPVEPR